MEKAEVVHVNFRIRGSRKRATRGQLSGSIASFILSKLQLQIYLLFQYVPGPGQPHIMRMVMPQGIANTNAITTIG